MNRVFQLTLIMLAILARPATAQDARLLVKEGIELSNAKNYTAAIEKYKAALAADPENTQANYQLAFALNALGKGTDAIPYLQKVIGQQGVSAQMLSSAHSLLGGIYDKGGQAKLSIENYQQAIKLDSLNAGLQYNIGLAYFRAKQYANAEKSAAKAIMGDPKHAASLRLYALVTFHQNKRAAALLGLCSFLWMAPNEAHAAEAMSNIQSILRGGVLKQDPGSPALDADNLALNQAITQAVAEVSKRHYIVAADQFADELTAIARAFAPLITKQKGNYIFRIMAAQYYGLSKTRHMPTFARYIRQNTDKAAAEWLKQHAQEVADMKQQIRITFEPETY